MNIYIDYNGFCWYDRGHNFRVRELEILTGIFENDSRVEEVGQFCRKGFNTFQ